MWVSRKSQGRSTECSSSTHPSARTCSTQHSSARGRWRSGPCGVRDGRSMEWIPSTDWRIPPCQSPSSAHPVDKPVYSQMICQVKVRTLYSASSWITTSEALRVWHVFSMDLTVLPAQCTSTRSSAIECTIPAFAFPAIADIHLLTPKGCKILTGAKDDGSGVVVITGAIKRAVKSC